MKNDRLTGTTGDKQMYRILGLSVDERSGSFATTATATAAAAECVPLTLLMN